MQGGEHLMGRDSLPSILYQRYKAAALLGTPFATAPLGTFPASLPLTVMKVNWVWGGAAQVGTTYAFARGWFLDFSYTFARSANFTIENSVFVRNQIGSLTISGPAV